MKLKHLRKSRNVIDQRGRGGARKAGGVGIVGLIAAGVLMFVFDVDPQTAMQVGSTLDGGAQTSQTAGPPPSDAEAEFVAKVLSTTEDVWTKVLPRDAGMTYTPPKLVLFTGSVQSGCGFAQSAMGPFYCPADSRVYLDFGFFRELSEKLGAKGDFAAAYVIAHEVGHHVENLTGTLGKAHATKQRVSKKDANAISVRVELMADCYAGLWAKHAEDMFGVLEPGDIQEAMTAAAAVGDDALQKKSQGHVVPDSFTHGTSEQRMRWFDRGFRTGSMRACDTFA